MTELRIIAEAKKQTPDYSRTAGQLLAACRSFYQDPENEKKYQEWKRRRSEKHEKAAV